MRTSRLAGMAPVLMMAALLAGGHAGVAHAAYPEKPIKLIVPFPAGGPTDAMARIVSEKMTQSLGQTVIVENRGGAGGVIATEAAAASAANGYTLFFATTGTMTINPSIYPNMGVKPLKAFDPIGMVASTENVLVVAPSLKIDTVQDLVAQAKSEPGTFTFGSAGVGSSNHLSGELLKDMAGIDILHVPYKGSAAALTDLLGGRISMMFDTISNALPNIQAGKVVPLGVTGTAKSPALPAVPTIADAGLPGFQVSIWFGLVAPHGTPSDAIKTLNASLNKILAESDVQAKLQSFGATPTPGSPEVFASQMNQDEAKWSRLIKTSGMKVN
ncbi:MAG TPA: tripartite tricarboxylate transporter substrate binding protein [Burkholderiaceae bacterium]|nr:tripartite tricarboxylate transporter substrate binding protein [Burkholderiaceae bacterium]